VAVNMALWRMTDAGPVPVEFSQLQLERRLEDMVVADPSLTGVDLMIIGRQVTTAYGGFIDILAVDCDGRLHVLELKRDRTPRDVVAQALDYGSWVQSLTLDDVTSIYAEHGTADFESAFAERFGVPVPDVFNADQAFTIVASELDPTSDRIVEFLSTRFAVPINAVFFRYFADGDSEFLARTWLIEPEARVARPARSSPRGSQRPWNGRDYYVVLGRVDTGSYRWRLGAKYGFVGAGGGAWYSKPLRNLTPGSRVFAYVGGAGYVGIGEVVGTMVPLRDFKADVNGGSIEVINQADIPGDLHERAMSTDGDVTEYAVPVRWLVRRPIEQAVSERGLFASQLSACKLRDDRTIDVVTAAFGVPDD
jgi:hypothetical protein